MTPEFKKENRRKSDPSARLPPHDIDAEQGVLGCVLLSPVECMAECRRQINGSGGVFYDLRNQTIYDVMSDMHTRRMAIDIITVQSALKTMNLLEQVGGIAYLSALPDVVPSTAHIDAYLHTVVEKALLRKMLRACTEVVGQIYEKSVEADALFIKTKQDLAKIFTRKGNTQQTWSVKDLMSYDPDKDPNAVIGMHDGRTTRYLCKGSGAWIIGQSGIGKSSLGIQQGFTWSLGRPFIGIHPVRPLRVLIVQNENDQGDCAEATQGVVRKICQTPEEFDLVNERVKIIRCRGKTGKDFCFWLEQEIFEWKADLVYVDPLLRFAGIDVSRQDQCTKFLNDQLDPMLASTEVVLIGAHHTGKPKTQKETSNWTVYDYAYSGIGSSELVNWARAISILRVLSEEQRTFDLMLSKRGSRAWATHPNGEFTTTIYLRHSDDAVYWEQLDPGQLQHRQERKGSGGERKEKPNMVVELASENLHDFCGACVAEGEGLREIARRFENYQSSKRKDISNPTAIRVIRQLVANGKITKTTEGKYIKGPNA